MKILLTFLTIVLINFNAKASKMFSVGTLYEYCSLYKENNFKLKGLNPLMR